LSAVAAGTALELRHIEAGYGTTTVLRDVSISVPASSVVALLGANGAGKTTLLRTASGLLKPAKGEVLIDGEPVTGSRPHQLADRGLCHIPEGHGIFPSLTVQENLILQSVKGREADALERAIAAFPVLRQRLRSAAASLSGGQQQMLALARAYLRDPRVILVDEASIGLSPKLVDEIFEFLGRVGSQGSALLLVDQYVTRALALAEFAYVLSRGHVTFAGKSEDLLNENIFQKYIGSAATAI
jgi:branched-chain amino acid transport system ATP-binding protein